MPAQTPPEEDTIFRNIGLIASWWNVLIFVIQPPLVWSFSFKMMMHFIKVDFLNHDRHWPFFLSLAPILLSLKLEADTKEKLVANLKSRGYVQEVTTARSIDLGLNVAVLGAIYYWTQNLKGDDFKDTSVVFVYAIFLFLLECGQFLLILGPTIWFTVKSTSA